MREDEIYKSMYLFLFNAVTDALGLIETEPGQAMIKLQTAQQHCEELFANAASELKSEIKYELDGCNYAIHFV